MDEHDLGSSHITDTAHAAALVPGTDGFLGQSLAQAIAWTVLPSGLQLADGSPVTVAASGATVTGTAGATTAFTLTVAADGTYSYDQALALFHSGSGADVRELDFSFTVTDGDGDTSGAATITVNVTDDVSTANNVAASMSENATTTITLVAGTDYRLGNDGSGSPALALGTATLDSTVAISLNQSIIGLNGNTVTITPGTTFDALPFGTSATLHIPYTARDADGDTSTNEITVTVNGVNDAPAAVADSGTTSESAVLNVSAANGCWPTTPTPTFRTP